MNLSVAIEKIPEIEVDIKMDNEANICKSLLYSIYYLFLEQPKVLNNMKLNLNNIKSIIYDNCVSVNNGSDSLMTFYYLNKSKLENSEFYKFYTLYLNLIKKLSKDLKEYTSVNVYFILMKKIDAFIEMEDNNE